MLNDMYNPAKFWHPLNIYNPNKFSNIEVEAPKVLACFKPQHKGVSRTVKGLQQSLEPKTEISAGTTIGVVMAAALVLAMVLPVFTNRFQK